MRGADAGRRRRKQLENWLQHKSLHVFAHMRSLSIDGAGTKSISQQMGRTPIFPCPLPNLTPKTNFCPHKHGRSTQGAPPSIRLCVNEAMVVQREYQNPPVSALQPLCTCVNIPLLFLCGLNSRIWLYYNIYAGHTLA